MSTVGTPKSPEQIQYDWDTNPRWKGITRSYTPPTWWPCGAR
jgi:isocitrate lyase